MNRFEKWYNENWVTRKEDNSVEEYFQAKEEGTHEITAADIDKAVGFFICLFIIAAFTVYSLFAITFFAIH